MRRLRLAVLRTGRRFPHWPWALVFAAGLVQFNLVWNGGGVPWGSDGRGFSAMADGGRMISVYLLDGNQKTIVKVKPPFAEEFKRARSLPTERHLEELCAAVAGHEELDDGAVRAQVWETRNGRAGKPGYELIREFTLTLESN